MEGTEDGPRPVALTIALAVLANPFSAARAAAADAVEVIDVADQTDGWLWFFERNSHRKAVAKMRSCALILSLTI